MKDVEHILGIHLPLPDDIEEKIVSVKQRVQVEYEGNYNFDPHITLHLSKFPQQELTALVEKLRQLELTSIDITLGEVKRSAPDKKQNVFFYLDVSRSDKLFKLHSTVVEHVNQYRDGMVRSRDKHRIEDGYYSEEEVKYIKRYGYLRSMDKFNPHITLGKIDPRKKEPQELFNFLDQQLQSLNQQTFNIKQMVVGLFPFDIQADNFLQSQVKKYLISLE